MLIVDRFSFSSSVRPHVTVARFSPAASASTCQGASRVYRPTPSPSTSSAKACSITTRAKARQLALGLPAMLHTCGSNITQRLFTRHSWLPDSARRSAGLLENPNSDRWQQCARYHRRSLAKKRHEGLGCAGQQRATPRPSGAMALLLRLAAS